MPAVAATGDAARTERSLGSADARDTVVECFSLTCPHCANFALETLPDLKARWIAPGRLRWVFYDFPGDMAALQAAMVARYAPADRYEQYIDVLFATRDRWAYAEGDIARDALRQAVGQAGMKPAVFDQAVADTRLRDWIVGRALDAEARWHVAATPSFLINGKLYEGDMSATEFAGILAD